MGTCNSKKKKTIDNTYERAWFCKGWCEDILGH